MPMLYGEGKAAFARLQGEIIRKYNDLSIFAWGGPAVGRVYRNILAPSPSAFADHAPLSDHANTRTSLVHRLAAQFSVTNQGVFFPSAKLQYQSTVKGYSHHYVLNLKYPNPALEGKSRHRKYILLRKIGPGVFVRLRETLERQEAFRNSSFSAFFYEPVCILNNLKASETLVWQLNRWEHYAIRVRWKPWDKHGQKFWHIRNAEPTSVWDVAGRQFLQEMASEMRMSIGFVPGNYSSNPHLHFFVVVIDVLDGRKQDTAFIRARIADLDTWQSSRAHAFGSRFNTAVPQDARRISIAGYEISLSVKLQAKSNETPHHLLYVDWTESKPSTQESR